MDSSVNHNLIWRKSTYLSLCHLVVVVREGQIATPGVDVHVVP